MPSASRTGASVRRRASCRPEFSCAPPSCARSSVGPSAAGAPDRHVDRATRSSGLPLRSFRLPGRSPNRDDSSDAPPDRVSLNRTRRSRRPKRRSITAGRLPSARRRDRDRPASSPGGDRLTRQVAGFGRSASSRAYKRRARRNVDWAAASWPSCEGTRRRVVDDTGRPAQIPGDVAR